MRLQVNEEKSGVRKPEEVHFLGFASAARRRVTATTSPSFPLAKRSDD